MPIKPPSLPQVLAPEFPLETLQAALADGEGICGTLFEDARIDGIEARLADFSRCAFSRVTFAVCDIGGLRTMAAMLEGTSVDLSQVPAILQLCDIRLMA